MKSFYLLKPYFAENRVFILFGIVCLVVVDFLQLYIPRIIKHAVDDLATLRVDLEKLLSYSLEIVGIAVIIGILRYVWRRCLIGTSRRVEEGLRNILFNHIQTLSAGYFDKIKTGDLMAHATNDIQHVRMATGMGIVALTDAIVLGSASIGFMAYINVKLTLLVLVPMPLIVFGTRFFGKKMHHRYQEVQKSFSDMTEEVRERFAGIRIIKAYCLEKEEARNFEAISKKYVSKNLSLMRIVGSFFPMMLFFSNVSIAIIIFMGGRQAVLSTITPGDFAAFISYLGLLTWPMMAMGWVANLIQRGRASLDRINTILETRPDIKNAAPGGIAGKSGNIIFEDVFFSYASGRDNTRTRPVLSKINYEIKQGDILGIVGPPGSGKTTLANLVPRLYDVSGGRILIGNQDIRKIDLKGLRSMISYMPQEPFLFAGTIRDNILFGNMNAGDSDLIKSMEQASLHETVMSFPDGFDTIVGEKGIILSGGQKQRIALARALMNDRPILILDDPISQVDVETGSEIIKSLQSFANKKTMMIISHRLSAIRFADYIIALDRGLIAEQGIHSDLLKNDEYYAKTFHMQKIEEKIDAV